MTVKASNKKGSSFFLLKKEQDDNIWARMMNQKVKMKTGNLALLKKNSN